MDRQFLLGAALVAAAATAGFLLQDQHYRLDVGGLPSDQQVIAHRDSPYTGMTWVVSRSNNYAQLRFFEMVEGGVCLEPTWAELAADPRLPHLSPAGGPPPTSAVIDPGTLNNSPYISLFPAGLLLNPTVPERPRVLIVGLGSGVGIAHLAHHFPTAEIEVVDIDPAVNQIVRDHYPLMAWLEREGRLKLVARDARAHIRERAGAGFHMVLLDAYTAGSTIPPHLMTREFFAECAATLADGGVLFANIIGSFGERDASGVWRGVKRRIVGGALRSFRAGDLPHAWVIPILAPHDNPGSFDRVGSRNNIIIAARHPLSPAAFPAGWERLRAWQPYPELASGRYVSRQYRLIDQTANTSSTFVPADAIDAAVPGLAAALTERQSPAGAPGHTRNAYGEDVARITAAQAAARALPAGSHLRGWSGTPSRPLIHLRTIDWVLFPRETWRTAIAFARDAAKHDPDILVGPVDGPEREAAPRTWHMLDAPLFTDQMPNADIMNH